MGFEPLPASLEHSEVAWYILSPSLDSFRSPFGQVNSVSEASLLYVLVSFLNRSALRWGILDSLIGFCEEGQVV